MHWRKGSMAFCNRSFGWMRNLAPNGRQEGRGATGQIYIITVGRTGDWTSKPQRWSTTPTQKINRTFPPPPEFRSGSLRSPPLHSGGEGNQNNINQQPTKSTKFVSGLDR